MLFHIMFMDPFNGENFEFYLVRGCCWLCVPGRPKDPVFTGAEHYRSPADWQGCWSGGRDIERWSNLCFICSGEACWLSVDPNPLKKVTKSNKKKHTRMLKYFCLLSKLSNFFYLSPFSKTIFESTDDWHALCWLPVCN